MLYGVPMVDFIFLGDVFFQPPDYCELIREARIMLTLRQQQSGSTWWCKNYEE